MPSVSFYHVQTKPVDIVVPELLEKALEAGMRICVRFPRNADLGAYSKALWTVNEDSFLPHAIRGEDDAELAPIFLTDDVATPSSLTGLFIINDGAWAEFEGFERCFYLFDGKSSVRVDEARKRWKELKDAGVSLRYLQQNNEGKWSEKASA